MNYRPIDVQVISKGMEIQRLEQELRENKDKYTREELSSGWRALKQLKLKSAVRDYKQLLRKWGFTTEYERYMENVADRVREEQMLRRDDLYE